MEARMSDKDKDKKIETTETWCQICGGMMVEYKGVYGCPVCEISEDTARRY